MTYCVGLALKDGLVLMSDTRTNAGVDNIATFSKMHLFETPGERVVVLLTSGNLAVTQAVVSLLREQIAAEEGDSLMTTPTLFRAAQLVGEAIRKVFHTDGAALKEQDVPFEVSILLGGQIKGGEMQLFQVYSAGNFIEATTDTPFLQAGEHKYGKPILDRAARPDMDLYDAVKLAMISMDSTLRSNLTVGMPIDLLIYRRGTQKVELRRRLDQNDSYFAMIRNRWSQALVDAYQHLPRPDWKS
ncbi:MAG TPA: proteasome-type protease [Stellaceae bacterium]|nr:proteasome-type protease [Stellaceae bacterium]